MIKKMKNTKYLYIRLIIAFFVFTICIFFATTSKSFYTRYEKVKSFEQIIEIELENQSIVEQNIQFSGNEIHSLGISLVNKTQNADGKLVISLQNEADELIWSEKMDVSLVKLGKVKWFQLRKTLETNEEYTILVKAELQKGKIALAGLYVNDNAANISQQAILQGQMENELSLFVETTYSEQLKPSSRYLIVFFGLVIIVYLLAFEIIFQNRQSKAITLFLTISSCLIASFAKVAIEFPTEKNKKIFCIVIGLLLVSAILCVLLLIKGVRKVEVYFLVTVGIVGVIYMILLPPFSSPDENRHYAASYRLSNALLLQPISDEEDMLYKRECDIHASEKYITNEYFLNMLEEIRNGEKEASEEMVVSHGNYAPEVPITLYIPQAVGIAVGKLLHFNLSRLIYCGRIFNFITFIIITFFAIKMIPYGKWILFSICQIPLTLELITSYSYDAIILAMTFLLIAYLLKIKEQSENIKICQLLVLLLLILIYAPLKPVYLPIVLLVFIIPDTKISTEKRRSIFIKTGIFLLAAMTVVTMYKGKIGLISNVTNKVDAQFDEDVVSDDWTQELVEFYSVTNNDPYNRPTLQFMLENPLHWIESYLGALINCFDEFLFSMFGKYLGWYDIILPNYIALIVMGLLMIAYCQEKNIVCDEVPLVQKILVPIIAAGCVFAIFTTFYLIEMAPSLKMVGGIQGRYFIPLLTLSCVNLGVSRKTKDYQCYLCLTALLIQCLTVLTICGIVWIR